MARMIITHINEEEVAKLNQKRYCVDIFFLSRADYDKAIKLGFNPTEWRLRNNMRIYYFTKYLSDETEEAKV